MRVVVPMLVLVAGCLAAEPGKDETVTHRTACTLLEGRTFQGSNGAVVAFVADDAEYSTWTESTTQSMGIAQCLAVKGTTIVYLDGEIDHYSARVDIRDGEHVLQWSDGSRLVSR